MNEAKTKLLNRKGELERRSIVSEVLTIGGVYHLLKELQEVNGKLECIREKEEQDSYRNPDTCYKHNTYNPGTYCKECLQAQGVKQDG